MRSGRYQASYTGPDMQRHTASTTFEDKATAESWLAVERRLIAEERWTSPRQRVHQQVDREETFGEYAAHWLERRRTAKGLPLKDRTREHYKDLLAGRILPAFEDLPLRSITPEMVDAWHEGMVANRTPTMTAHAYSLLHAILATAAKPDRTGRTLIPTNPCILDGAQKATTLHEARPASPAEIGVILANMAPPYRLPVALMYWCALRFGETVALERGDVDLRNRRVRVNKGVVKLKDGRRLDSTKNRTGRSVAYPPHLDELIREHLDNYAGPGSSGRLFTNSSGGYLAQSTLNGKSARRRRIKGRMVNESATGFRKACDAAERPDLRLHDLRHSGLTLAARTGATLAELMTRGGHLTPTAAMRYQHAAAERDTAIAEALSRMVET